MINFYVTKGVVLLVSIDYIESALVPSIDVHQFTVSEEVTML